MALINSLIDLKDPPMASIDHQKKISDEIKHNGEFDKCKREVLEKLISSDLMNETIEKCHRLVKTTMYKASPNTPLAKLREKIKETIRDKRLALPLFHLSEKILRDYQNESKLNEKIEDIARAHFQLPPRDSNIDLVDMDVSSGASTSTTYSSSSSATSEDSTSNFKQSECLKESKEFHIFNQNDIQAKPSTLNQLTSSNFNNNDLCYSNEGLKLEMVSEDSAEDESLFPKAPSLDTPIVSSFNKKRSFSSISNSESNEEGTSEKRF